MRPKHVVIELSPTRLAVAIIGRRAVVDFRVAALEQPDWDTRWPLVLAGLESPLSKMVQELGAAGSTATVLYWAPSALAAVFSCPASAGPAGAERAALLALGEQTHLALAANPHEAHCLGADPASSPDARSGPQRHTLAVVDQDSSTMALAALLRQVGLEPVAIIPGDAAPMSAVVRSVMERRDDQGLAVLWLGEHTSILAAGSGGRVRFTRVLRIGTHTLLEALRRPIRRPGHEPGASAESVTLDKATAARILATAGVPEPDSAIEGAPGVSGAALLPLLQPVLQRIALEIKQSLRFGMAEDERAKVVLAVEGGGSAIPRLGEALSALCGTPLAAPEQCPGIGMVIGDPAGEEPGLVAAWGHLDRVGVNLIPVEIESAHARRKLRKRVWAGLGAALALVALYAGSTRLSLASAQDQLVKARAMADQVQQDQAAQNAARAASALQRALQGRLQAELPASPDWAGLLALLSQHTPQTVRLTGVDMQVTEAGPTAQINGFVRTTDAAEFARMLREFSTALEEAAIVSGVRLGATQRVQVRGTDVQRFEMTLLLVPVSPPDGAAQTLLEGGNS